MGKYDYLIKRGWSKEEAKEYVDSMEEGLSPTEAYERVLGKGEKKAIVKREPVEIEVRPIKPSKPSVVKNIIKETKELGGTIVKEAKEYVPGKIRSVREDLETKRAYRESYRKHGYEAASSRGAEAELRHHKEMIGKEARRIKLEEEREKIALAAEKAARVERAKILTKQKYASRPTRSQIVRMKPPVQNTLRQQYSSLDPYLLYSIRPNPNADTTWSSGRTSSIDIFGVTGNPEAMYSLLGFNQPKPKTQSNKKRLEKSKSKQKQKRYNIFSGTWEEV